MLVFFVHCMENLKSMRKLLLLLICLAAIQAMGQTNPIQFELDVPDNVVAGTDFEVTLLFNKDGLQDYSRFSQELPVGFTAENINSPNADFTFQDQRIRIIWLKLPEEDEVVVKYKIKTAERIAGKLELKGSFAYVVRGERAYSDIEQPVTVNILPNPDLDPSLVIDIAEYGNYLASNAAAGSPGISSTIVRQKPVKQEDGSYVITLLLSLPPSVGILKLEETVPTGYLFREMNSAGSKVSVAGSLARFMWMTPPENRIFLVKYRLVPQTANQPEPVIDGTLSFAVDGASKVVTPKEIAVDLAAMTTMERAEFMQLGKLPAAAMASSGGQSSQNQQVRQGGPKVIQGIDVLQPVQGIVFRVQLGAFKNAQSAKAFYGNQALLKGYKIESENGLYKFTVGPFSSYNQAHNTALRIEKETNVENPFVVGYRDGKRVPLDDIL